MDSLQGFNYTECETKCTKLSIKTRALDINGSIIVAVKQLETILSPRIRSTRSRYERRPCRAQDKLRLAVGGELGLATGNVKQKQFAE
jgi:hypothetical protein